MKKILLLFAVALFVVSCQGPAGQEGPQGPGTNWKIINLVANQSDWQENLDKNGLNRFYSCHFTMPEINSTVFNDGNVASYIMINSAQQTLPYVLHLQDTKGNLWTRTIDFDYSVGGMNVYVTNSDFVVDPPGTMNFRVALTW
jgi:hypothetical protein